MVSQNNETAAMLVSQTSPVGDKFAIDVGHVSENTLYFVLVLNFATVIYVLSINVKLYLKKKYSVNVRGIMKDWTFL